MRVDSHQHFWTIERGDYGWLTPEIGPIYRDYGPADLAPNLVRNAIDRTVLVQAAPSVAETHYLLDLAAANDFIAGVVGWVEMSAPDAAELIRSIAENSKLLGIRPMIQDIADPDWMLGETLTPAFEAMLECALTFDALVLPQHLENLRRLLNRYPDLKCVIDHGAKPRIAEKLIDEWATDMGRIASETGAFCKLSGLLTEAGARTAIEQIAPYAQIILDTFGPQRTMWGSDWPVLELAGDYDGWFAMANSLTAGLSDSDRAEIFGGTARRFYGIQ